MSPANDRAPVWAARPDIRSISLPAPCVDGAVNAYLLPDEPVTLVDPGPDTADARAALEAGLDLAGKSLGGVRVVVVTHTHVDHFGLAAWVQSRSGARIVCHPTAAMVLSQVGPALDARLELVRRAAAAAGIAEGIIESAVEWLRSRAALAGDPASSGVQAIREGGRLRAGGADWLALHCPGHSPDGLLLLHRPSGCLVAGDVLLLHRRTATSLEGRQPDGSRPSTLADLIRSWQRLSRLRLAVAWPGHGAAVRAHRILVARRLAETRESLKATRHAVAAGAGTLAEVAETLGCPLDAENLADTLGDVVALTDWLVERDLLVRRTVGGLLRLSPGK